MVTIPLGNAHLKPEEMILEEEEPTNLVEPIIEDIEEEESDAEVVAAAEIRHVPTETAVLDFRGGLELFAQFIWREEREFRKPEIAGGEKLLRLANHPVDQ